MKVLVTGGCGFVGSWACEYYARRGERVVAFDNLTKHELVRTDYNVEPARDYNWDYLSSLGVEMVRDDIRDRDALFEHADGADFIVHTAAQPAMTISIEDPQLDFTTNVIGTVNVLDAARRFGIPMVSCATIHVYGNGINQTLSESATRYQRHPPGIDEHEPTLSGKLTPLHASKMSGDIYTRTWIDSYGLEAATFRLSGLYGPRQLGGEDHGWVANFTIRALLGMPINIYGSGKQVRDILYVGDLVEAFEAFRRCPVPGVYNVGGGSATAISLLECIDLIREITGRQVEVRFGETRQGDLSYFVCDTTRIRDALGWVAKTLPKEGVARLATWVKDNQRLFAP